MGLTWDARVDSRMVLTLRGHRCSPWLWTGGDRDLFLRLVPSRVGIFGEILNDAQNVILRRFCVAGLSPLDWRSLAGNVGKSFKTPDSSSASS